MARRRAQRISWSIAAVAALTMTTVGCAPNPDDSEGGMGLPVVGWFDDAPAGDTELSGTMRVADNGCFHLENGTTHQFIVWPDGFEHDGAQVRTASGGAIVDGDPVSGTGVVLSGSDATDAGGGPDSQLGQAIGYCAEGGDVVVLTEVTGG